MTRWLVFFSSTNIAKYLTLTVLGVRTVNPATRIQNSAGPPFFTFSSSFVRLRLETVLTVMVINSLTGGWLAVVFGCFVYLF